MINRIKYYFPLIFIFILFICSFNPTVSARDYIFKTDSSIEISDDYNNTIILDPYGAPKTIEIEIKYTYNRLARPEGFPFPNQKKSTMINITINEKPDWCLASIDRGSFEIPIKTFLFKKNETVMLYANITFQIIDINAKAFEEGNINIFVESKENGNLKESYNSYNIKATPESYLSIDSRLLPSSILNVLEGEEKNITIKIKNKSNIKTVSIFESSYDSTLFNISVDEKYSSNDYILDSNEEKNFSIKIQTYDNLAINQSSIIIFDIISFPVNKQSNNSFSESLELQVNLNKKIENKDKSNLDWIDYLIYIAIFSIIVPIIFLYFYYKKKD